MTFWGRQLQPMNKHDYNEVLAQFERRSIESERFHMGVGKVHETLDALAADLDGAKIDYAIIDGMALNAHGYRREAVDIDVLVTSDGLRAFSDQFVGKGYCPAFEGATKTFRNTRSEAKVEFITSGEYPGDGKPKPVVFPTPESVAIEVQGARVVNLAMLIELKLASGMTQPARRRDLADVQDLIRLLGLDASFVESLNPYVHETFKMLLDELNQDDPHAEQ